MSNTPYERLMVPTDRVKREWAAIVGHNIRRRRVELNVSQTAVATAMTHIGFLLSTEMVSAIERHRPFRVSSVPGREKAGSLVIVTVDMLMGFAEVLGCTGSELLR